MVTLLIFNMKRNLSLINFLLYLGAFLLTVSLFVAQIRSNAEPLLFFLLVFLLGLFTFCELISVILSFWLATVITLLLFLFGLLFSENNTLPFLLLTIGQSLIISYYFLVHQIRKRFIEQFFARERYFKELVIEKTQALQSETEARLLAEKAIRDRDEFLSIASHELKTPLTTVILQLQATLKKVLTQSLADFSGKDLLSSLQIVEKQSQTLSTLIKDLLNVSLASTGRLTLTKENVNLGDLVNNLVTKYTAEINSAQCQIEIQLKHNKVIGFYDPVRIEQAITNLLMNALKYAPGKKITLIIDTDGDSNLFRIIDQGPGIPKHLHKLIFEPFKRGGNTQTKGLGVGLFITHQIVTEHQGQINVSSNNEGTTFTLKLPKGDVTKENRRHNLRYQSG